jgi:hypothetical protein
MPIFPRTPPMYVCRFYYTRSRPGTGRETPRPRPCPRPRAAQSRTPGLGVLLLGQSEPRGSGARRGADGCPVGSRSGAVKPRLRLRSGRYELISVIRSYKTKRTSFHFYSENLLYRRVHRNQLSGWSCTACYTVSSRLSIIVSFMHYGSMHNAVWCRVCRRGIVNNFKPAEYLVPVGEL